MKYSRKTRRTLHYSHDCHGLNLKCTSDFYLNVWFSNGYTAFIGSRNFVERDKPRKVSWGADIMAFLILAYWILNYFASLFRFDISYISSGHLSSTAPSTRHILVERSSFLKICLWRKYTLSSETRLDLIPGKYCLSCSVLWGFYKGTAPELMGLVPLAFQEG